VKKGENKKVIYHETICQKNKYLKVRVIQKDLDTATHIFVLSIYLKESTIRNKLKEMHNRNILHRISFEKIEVLFVEDEYLHDELNALEDMNEAEKSELKETLERVSEVYMDNNFIKDVSFIKMMVSLKVAHLSTLAMTQVTTAFRT
jgi:hypothetical protein